VTPIERDRELVEGATPKQWFCELDGIYNAGRSYMVVPTGDSEQDVADAAFIAAARNRWPLYIELAEAVRVAEWHWEECVHEGEGPCCLNANRTMVAALHAIEGES
jgi:hypothetical protein